MVVKNAMFVRHLMMVMDFQQAMIDLIIVSSTLGTTLILSSIETTCIPSNLSCLCQHAIKVVLQGGPVIRVIQQSFLEQGSCLPLLIQVYLQQTPLL